MQPSTQVTERDSDGALRFRHERIDENPPSGQLSQCLTTDLTGNGRPDVIVTTLGARPELSVGGKTIKIRDLPGFEQLYARMETNVFWYENPGWERHTLATETFTTSTATAASTSSPGRAIRPTISTGSASPRTPASPGRSPSSPAASRSTTT
jgi:hypothetical protein